MKTLIQKHIPAASVPAGCLLRASAVPAPTLPARAKRLGTPVPNPTPPRPASGCWIRQLLFVLLAAPWLAPLCYGADPTLPQIAQQAYVKASNTGPGDQFGYSVAVSGDTVVIGAKWEDSAATGVNGNQASNSSQDSGAAYVLVRDGTNWIQQAYLKAPDTRALDEFAYSVAISGDTIAVGRPYYPNGDASGVVYVFVRNGTNWSQEASLRASTTGIFDFFGSSVAVAGDTIVVGASEEDSNATGVNGNQSDNSAGSAGAAYVFVRDGTNWSQQAYLKASNTGGIDRFGLSVAISGDTIVVGAPLEDSNATGVNGNQADNSATDSGAVYVFTRSGTNWSQQAYLKASNTGAQDRFGYSVAAAGDTLAVAAPFEDSNATGVNGNQGDNSAANSGAAYVFVRSGTNWIQQAYLKTSNTDAGDGSAFPVPLNDRDPLGYSVAVSGDTVVVGAQFEDGADTSVNGDQTSNGASASGAAYIFKRIGTNWTQQAYLKASNTGTGDAFGFSVAASGATVVIGAYLEDSNATGVNGSQTNNLSDRSGAAYIFTTDNVRLTLAIAPDGSSGYFIRFQGVAGSAYQLLRASDVTGPWDSIATNTAPASGLIEFHDSTPLPGQAFYRAATP